MVTIITRGIMYDVLWRVFQFDNLYKYNSYFSIENRAIGRGHVYRIVKSGEIIWLIKLMEIKKLHNNCEWMECVINWRMPLKWDYHCTYNTLAKFNTTRRRQASSIDDLSITKHECNRNFHRFSSTFSRWKSLSISGAE